MWSDPPPDSLFVKVSSSRCRCTACDTEVPNTAEAREAHLSIAEFTVNEKVADAHRALYERS